MSCQQRPDAPKSLRDTTIGGFLAAAVPILLGAASVARAAPREGAFEMDMRFYLRDLVNGGKPPPEGSALSMTKRKPVFPSPRTLNADIVKAIADVVCTEISRVSGMPVPTIAAKAADAVPALVQSTFASYVPLRAMDFSDQYYLDIYLYALYLVAAVIIPQSVDRVELRKGVGKEVLALLARKKLVTLPPIVSSATVAAGAAAAGMQPLCQGVENLLKAFAGPELRLIDSYIFDAEDAADERYAAESFNLGRPVSFQVTLKGPATILGFLEETASNNFFHPEILATTVAAYMRTAGYKVRMGWEDRGQR